MIFNIDVALGIFAQLSVEEIPSKESVKTSCINEGHKLSKVTKTKEWYNSDKMRKGKANLHFTVFLVYAKLTETFEENSSDQGNYCM